MALLKRSTRNATVKAELNCEFASFHYTKIKKSLTKIDDDYLTPKIHFLQNIPAFKGLTRKKTLAYYRLMQKFKFTRGQTVYMAGQPVESVFIILKGEFELVKKLARFEDIQDEDDTSHTLASRLIEVKDFP